jgi:hypothetical protein
MRTPGTPRGRPRDFLDKVKFMVLLDRHELDALRLRAVTDGMSASAFARAAIMKAVAAKRAPRRLPRPQRRGSR